MTTLTADNPVTLMQGDCLSLLPSIPSASVDAVISDPPYPEIDRPYGRMTEPAWHEMMRGVVTECRRVLKPSGSAVFILQPNSERVGRMRPWLWEFMAWTAREWNQVQDFWWWNFTAPPTVHCHRARGLARPSVKACVWLGDKDCFRNQNEILWAQSEANKMVDRSDRVLEYRPCGQSQRRGRMAAAADERGGVTPFNLIPLGGRSPKDCDANEHGAATPDRLCDWWVRYISPQGGTVLDPFIGSGTVGIAAVKRWRKVIGIERDPGYFATAERRINEAVPEQMPLFGAAV